MTTPLRNCYSVILLGLTLMARPAAAQQPAGTVVDVTAHEYAFSMPDSVPAGLVTFRLGIQGKEWHHIKLVKLDDGHTLAQVYAALRAGEKFPSWMHFIGGPNSPPAGQTVSATLALEPGQYALWCNVTAPDGKPHWAHGMLKALTVTPPARQAGLPAGDLTITLRDYAFDLSQPLTRGAHTIRVNNAAAQAHEVFMLRLDAEAGAEDVEAWLEKRRARAPGEAFGGTTDIQPGGTLRLQEAFQPGRYALICWVNDAHDGEPHWRHGMVRVINVR
ncbi:MAG TPA: hypothetical protein VFS74_06745 [Gemmatimonadales bacterium]|nr:hypothetical protein [Gemmatimonadales bacterium]